MPAFHSLPPTCKLLPVAPTSLRIKELSLSLYHWCSIMKALNSKQKNGLWLGIVMAIAMGITPPWIERHGGAAGPYAPIYAPPLAPPDHPAMQIDYSRLLLQWAMTALVTAGLVVTGQDEQKSSSDSKVKLAAGPGSTAGSKPGAGQVVQSQPAIPVPSETTRQLKFPDKSKVGDLLIESADDPEYWDWVADAQGAVEVPAKGRIQLEIEKESRVDLGSLGRTEMAAIASVDASDSKVSDDDLALIAALKNLQELDLTNTGVTDAGLQHLTRMRSLEKLWLDGTKVTDQGLNALKQLPNLIKVSFTSTEVSDSSIISLKEETQGKCQFVLSSGQNA